MSEKEENNVIDFLSKSKTRRISKEQSKDMPVTDKEFKIFMKAFLGEYNGPSYNPE